MQLGEDAFKVTAGDTIYIPPDTPHCITGLGDQELVLLCCCSPAYDHTDTELLEKEES
jgi:mannose-6-phosphate isomerase-like protein (cupin superfamily)